MNFSNGSNATTSGKYLVFIPTSDLNVFVIVFLTLISLLLVILACCSNLFLIVNLVKKSPVPLCNHLIINLCLADFSKSCLYFIIHMSTPARSWFLGSFMCKVLPGLLGGYSLFSLDILRIIARQSFYAICKPLNVPKQKKWKTYAELFITASFCVGGYLYGAYVKNSSVYIEDATRCVVEVHQKGDDPAWIAVGYFCYFTIIHIFQIYYFIRIACTLRKNSKHLGDNKIESSQRLRRNKKAVRTIFTMLVAYDVILLPSAIFKTLALYHTDLGAEFRELSNIFVLTYCSFNSTFYIWRDENLKKVAVQFLKRLFCSRC